MYHSIRFRVLVPWRVIVLEESCTMPDYFDRLDTALTSTRLPINKHLRVHWHEKSKSA